MAGKNPPSTSAMIEALHADGALAEHADKVMLFGRLVGSWDIEVRFFDEVGNITRQRAGEWHFGWVLQGRVIQDVVIVPPRAGREPGTPSTTYDTTLWAYDPKADAWRVSVIAPIHGVTLQLTARGHGDEIWLEGSGPQGEPIRWIFSEFSEDRVRWQGFVTRDEGKTWIRGEEIILTRQR